MESKIIRKLTNQIQNGILSDSYDKLVADLQIRDIDNDDLDLVVDLLGLIKLTELMD